MAQRKPFLLRVDPATHEALQRWADADLRSLNAQIEFLLRRALIDSGRLKPLEPMPVVEEGVMSFQESAKSWEPPEGLGYSSLRPVRLTGQGIALTVLAIV